MGNLRNGSCEARFPVFLKVENGDMGTKERIGGLREREGIRRIREYYFQREVSQSLFPYI